LVPIAAVVLLLLAGMDAGAAPPDDAYLAGYVAAVLERQLNVTPRSLRVANGVVSVDAADVPRDARPKVLSSLSAIPGVLRVELTETPGAPPPAPGQAATVPPAPPTEEGPALGFLPEGYLFRPLIADPRWPHFSGAYRYYITTSGPKNVFAGSFGETIPLYRGSLGAAGQWDVGLQAGVFSIFELDGGPSFDLINTDFFVAATLGYRIADFSALGRYFHQSSHLGDELLLRETVPNRVNLSYEGLDLKLSYDLPLGLRAYGGGGYLVRVDPDDLGRGFAQAGAEWRSPWSLWAGRLRPVAGVDLQFREENDWHTDVSVRAGLQFESVTVLSRNLQVLAEYFNGRSFDGQFYRDSVEYLGVGLHFNF
jgi:hypothetical protein